MKRSTLALAFAIAMALLAGVVLTAQGFAHNCFGTVRNNTDATIYVQVKGQSGLGTYIAPHSTERLCSGR